ncbi:catechol 2,3-dioxygenase-like lactoylglutathione lyase family enzyme [Pseudomonas duriflava]|uniref:Catechol 2,3-dioxygenase-like lactoylglutathione lyase family enzyme n=1 Tax=Pseudomonas duriflava TaxID=459528 RepID=A0A562PUY6_9PSED|nr:VOC family protein [Pseudomonas duriflava]TWI47970.1 catechol 2,3-dioxygenase-like lactoylglutathione lyase family enzyme [Pseudomonas duriflava]
MNVRAIEHVGITVPDIEEATRFFVEAFGAQKLYDMLDEPLGGPGVEAGLGIPAGAVINVIRMLRLGNGPNLELFSYTGVAQAQPVVPSDFGIQHICIYVDDIDAAADRLKQAGGILLSQPNDLPGLDTGHGNRYVYTRTPWGSTIELVSYPSAQAYERQTPFRRWRPTKTSLDDLKSQSQ